MPSNFLPVPSHGLMVGTRGSLGRNYLCRFPSDGTPGHYTASEPTSSLNTGECPSRQVPHNAHVAGWRSGRLSEGHPSHALPTRPTALRAPHTAGHPWPLPTPAPLWALGLPRPTSPVPGVPTQRYSPFAATLPTGQQGSCTPPNGFEPTLPPTAKRLPFCEFN